MDGLRDYTFSSWSRVAGVPASAELDALYNESRKLSQSAPRLHSKHEVQESAQHADGSKKLTKLCQKPPQERTEEDINYVQEQVSRLAPFFRLWPEALQHELARALQTEVLVRHECVMARASQPTKLFFILEGKLSVRVPQLPSSTSSSAAPPPPLTPPLSPRHPPSPFLPTPPSPLSPASPFSQTSSGGRDRKGSRPGPQLGPPPPSAATSPGAGPQHFRTMATLKRGDACGEAALLGGASSQADVVVVSEGAVLLSLTRTDFLHAFKAILGLRQQDRLLYLRCHPLFAGVALGELDLLSDALHVAVYPPGACMLPLRPGTAPRLLLLAEGIATVRRSRGGRGGGPALSASRRAALEEGSMPVAYDCDTVSVLQPLDLLGSSLPPGQVVEADTQVKAYWLPTDQLPALPPGLQARHKGLQILGRSDHPSHWSDQAGNECDPDPKAHHHATTLAHTAVLGSLPPGMTALARIDNRRNHHRYDIQTEAPSQPLQPVSCVQRHMELFQQSLHAAMQRWPSRRPQYGYTTEVGEEEGTGRGGSGEGGLGGWPGAAWTQEQRQPSRRLSGDPRSRQCRDSSGGGSRNKRSGGRAGPGAGDGGQSCGGGRAEGTPARPPHQQSVAQQQQVYI
ncbi:hypothetical protein QJQ45_018545, partial [Haematococcus lacustris]